MRRTWPVTIALIFILAIVLRAPFRNLGLEKSTPQEQLAVVGALVEEKPTSDFSLPQIETYPVVRVVDGDTIVINRNGKNETIRLIGLDTPETVDPQSSLRSRSYYGGVGQAPVQCFGIQASDEAKKLLTGKRVRIEMDPSQGERDKYGRLLAYVFMEDLPAPGSSRQAGGTLFNQLMISEGFGHEYTYNIPYKYQQQFQAAEKTAREEKKGLWAPGVCQTRASGTPSIVV
ncbi:MAG: thermonuclease family protein [bacterium]|nr:thermonuclease family protein [bacterium]